MKKILLLLLPLVFVNALAQTEAEYELKYAVDYYYEGFKQSDSTKMRAVMHRDFILQSIQKDEKGVYDIVYSETDSFIKLVVDQAKMKGWEEELDNYEYNIDGSFGTVWVPYKFYVNGMMTHCGVNAIQLIKDQEGYWKILSITDTRRKECIIEEAPVEKTEAPKSSVKEGEEKSTPKQ